MQKDFNCKLKRRNMFLIVFEGGSGETCRTEDLDLDLRLGLLLLGEVTGLQEMIEAKQRATLSRALA